MGRRRQLLELATAAVARKESVSASQVPQGGFIVIAALGLDVGAVVTAAIGAFVPIEPQPGQVFQGRFGGAGHGTGWIQVLQSPNQDAALRAHRQPGDEGGAGAAYVQQPRRGRRPASSYLAQAAAQRVKGLYLMRWG